MIAPDTIICGDCLEIMPDIESGSVDLCLTDPPYGVERDKGFGGFGGFGKPIARRSYADVWDKNRPGKDCFDEILRVGKRVAICGGNYFADILPQSTHWIVWDKLNTMPTFGDCELIWTNSDRKSVKKYTLEWNGLLGKEGHREHPTQKPVALMVYLLERFTKPGDLVLDPFMGSGTTLVACKQLDRRYIGIELSEHYCEVAKRRVSEAKFQHKLF